MALTPFTQDAPPGERTVWVSRHARTSGNEAGLMQGWSDNPLSACGRRDLDAARTWWAHIPVSWVVTSPVLRAVQTGDALFGRVNDIDSGWTETAIPGLAGLNYVEAHAARPDLCRPDGWALTDHRRDPAQEHLQTVADRALGALRRAATAVPAGANVAVVTHGGVLAGLLEAAHWRPNTVWGSATLANLAVIELTVDPSVGWAVAGVHSPLTAPAA
jgi:broad specificity phosphatase PhoE